MVIKKSVSDGRLIGSVQFVALAGISGTHICSWSARCNTYTAEPATHVVAMLNNLGLMVISPDLSLIEHTHR